MPPPKAPGSSGGGNEHCVFIAGAMSGLAEGLSIQVGRVVACDGVA